MSKHAHCIEWNTSSIEKQGHGAVKGGGGGEIPGHCALALGHIPNVYNYVSACSFTIYSPNSL